MAIFNYPDSRDRTAKECRENSRHIRSGAKWVGVDIGPETEIDICTDGSVYIGLTQVLPANSVTVESN